MDFEYQDGLSKEEVEYINGLVGYKLRDEDDIVIRSTKEKIYNITVQFGHPDPDLRLDDIEVIIYNDHLIRLQSRVVKGGVNFSRIFVPRSLKNEEDRVIEIIKEIQLLQATGKWGDPKETVVEYPNGIPIIYYDDKEMKPEYLFWEVHQRV